MKGPFCVIVIGTIFVTTYGKLIVNVKSQKVKVLNISSNETKKFIT